MKRLVLETEHETFRDSVRDFIERELEPHAEKWEADRLFDRSSSDSTCQRSTAAVV